MRSRALILNHGIKCQLAADKTDYRLGLISQIKREKPLYPLVDFLMGLPLFFEIICSSYIILRLCQVKIKKGDSSEMIIVRGPQEKKELLDPKTQATLISLESTPSTIRNLFHLRLGKMRKALRITRVLWQKEGCAIRVLRVLELMAYYSLFSQSSQRLSKPSKVSYSSDSNPWSLSLYLIGILGKAQKTFKPHGHIVKLPNRVFHDEIFFKTPLCYHNYTSNHGAVKKHHIKYRDVHISKKRSDHHFKQNLRVVIFLSKSVNWSVLDQTLEKLSSSYPEVENIALKFHPSLLLKKVYPQEDLSHLQASEALSHADIVLCGNSSVALEALMMGIPMVYLNELDYDPFDLYGLIESGLYPKELSLTQAIRDHFFSENWFQDFEAKLQQLSNP